MKLDEVKQLICQRGLTEALMAEFLLSLRRVRGGFLKAQHCYLLAYEIREQDYAGAVRLIEYALKHFAEDTMTRRFCYEHLARAHRANLNFGAAKACNDRAQQLLAAERSRKNETAAQAEALFALRNELELTGYQWSADLERSCGQIDREDALLLGLRDEAFTLAAADYLVGAQHQDAQAMAAAARQLQRLLQDEALSDVERMFQRHGVNPRVTLTEGESAFLQRIGLA